MKTYINEEMQLKVELGDLNIRVLHVNKEFPNKNWFVPEHDHECYELHIIPEGKGIIDIEGHTLQVSGGQFYLTGPYIKHTQKSDPKQPMAEYCFRFEIEPLGKESSGLFATNMESKAIRNYLSHCYPTCFDDRSGTIQKCEEMFNELETKQIGYRLRVQTLIVNILIDVLRAVSSQRTNVKDNRTSEEELRYKRILEFVENNYMRPISSEDVSHLLFLCTRQINRIMQQQAHMTFHQYLTQFRLSHAQQLIKTKNMSMEEVARQSGFSSHYYMYEVFKRHHLPTPSVIRERAKSG